MKNVSYMPKNTIQKIFLYTMIVLTILTLVVSLVYADHDPPGKLTGPAFSDPAQLIEMPAEWEKQRIKYDPSAGDANIVITLDQHLYPIFLPLIQQYAVENNLNIQTNEGTCGITAGMLSHKKADIGGYCCPPGITDRLPGLQFHTVGIGSIALLVHPDNPINNISMENARHVFSGEMFNWSELKTPDGKKGLDKPIQPVGRLHCKLRPGHWRLMLDNQDLFSTGIQEVGAIIDMISQITSNNTAIGHTKTWIAKHYSDKGAVKALNINGVSPYDQKPLISGEYPIYASYYLTTWEGENVENPEAQKLVKYLLEEGEKLDKKHHIVPASRLREAGWKFKDNELIGDAK